MREYKIVHFSKGNERAIKKSNGEQELRLCPDNSWSKNGNTARRFLYEDSAVGAFITIRHSWEPEIQKKEERWEKQSWGEFSSS